MQKEFMITEDGSHTIYLPEMKEHYHSVHGAVQESRHIYIEQGLLQLDKNEISILEIGFGTGLNAFLTFGYSKPGKLKISYTSIEKYPLLEKEYSQLNYPGQVFSEYAFVFRELHSAEWNVWKELDSDFRIRKLHSDLLTIQLNPEEKYDLIYYDAFAPDKQPEMWSNFVLNKVVSMLKRNGLLLTYCAKGAVRRSLAEAGLIMERIPGPKGKKEILRGKKEN